jgi:hypothetical protein
MDTEPANASAAAATEPALTIDDFCKIEGMGRATFYKLKRLGLTPEVTEIVLPAEPGVNRGRGLNFNRISAEAHRAWRKRIAELRATKDAELAAARAHAQRLQAAQLAAQSPLHVSKQKQQKRPRRGRAGRFSKTRDIETR